MMRQATHCPCKKGGAAKSVWLKAVNPAALTVGLTFVTGTQRSGAKLGAGLTALIGVFQHAVNAGRGATVSLEGQF